MKDESENTGDHITIPILSLDAPFQKLLRSFVLVIKVLFFIKEALDITDY